MRRQARISGGGALVARSASALQVWLWLLIFIFQNEFRISRSIQPGYLDFDNLPETNFTCAGKVIGGYYADLETSCQMFHVCTVGQQDEPMDIKFLCLNGTVFDQETRVCERVDEVDCTKSEKFYSLNLELYGSTAPPIIQPDQPKSQDNKPQTKPKHEQENDPSVDVASTTTNDKSQGSSQDVADSTEDPVQEIKKDTPKHPASTTSSSLTHNEELTLEYQEEDEDDGEYEDYSHVPTTTQKPATTTTKYSTTTMTTTTKSPPTTTIVYSSTVSRHQSPITHLISSPSPVIPSLLPSAPSPLQPSAPSALSAPSAPSVLSGPSVSSLPSLDPTLLSPQEFIYRHRGPGSEAISFQSFRPADGVYITHAPPHQFDHFQYESSRTAPRPAAPRPTPFVQRPQPAPFRTTTLDPRDQILRPGPTSQPSERQETSVKNRQQPYPSSLPAQRPLPFNPYYYDRKRSEDSEPGNESSLSARSVAPVAVTERPPIKLKSPPRVIVTASASVSDSTGKRLNYTVGNVVKAVKPIVPINYDDYKESDLIFDPFFLDVPKLQKRRKTRSNSNRRIFTIPATTAVSPNLSSESPTVASSPVTSRATTTERASTTSFHNMMTTATWNPNDYVDDNYEPHAYVPPVPPLAVLVPQHLNKLQTQEKQTVYNLVEIRTHRDKSKAGRTEQPKPTSAPAAQTTSSQREGADTAPLAPAPAPAVASAVASVPAASPSPSPPLEASACVSSRSTDCRIRA